MVLPAILVVAVVVVGVALTFWLPVGLRAEERLAVGAVLGIVSFCLVAFAAFEVVGMGWLTVVLGLALPGLWAAAGIRRSGDAWRAEANRAVGRLRMKSRQPASLRPLAALTLAAGAVATRTLSLAYQYEPTGIRVGSLAVYGDWSAHLAYAGSFAYGDNRTLRSPIAAGSPLRYHFLSDFFAAPFTVTGATLPQALTISAWVLAVTFTPLLWCAARRLSGSGTTAGLTVVLFTLSGGVGGWFFLQDLFRSGWHVATTIPVTYSRLPERNLWLDNTISAGLYAQRSTLMGLCIGLAALVVLLAARVRWARSGFAVAGVLVGVCGIVFVHMLFTALALGAIALWFDRRREWWWFLLPAASVGLPIAWAIRPPTSAMRWLVGWVAAEQHENWLVFWLRNAGLFLPLFVAVAVFGWAPRRLVRLAAPLWAWFIAANLVSFHPWPGNNSKFFLFWQLAGSVVIAAALDRGWHRRPRRGASAGATVRRAGVCVVVAALVGTGGVDAVRGMERTTSIPWVAADEVALSTWLRQHADPGDVLVYGATNTSAVAALAGVPAVSGYPGWTVDLGLADWGRRVEDSVAILSGAPTAEALVQAYGVTWVEIGPDERLRLGASDDFWSRHGALAATFGDYRLYRVGERMPRKA